MKIKDYRKFKIEVQHGYGNILGIEKYVKVVFKDEKIIKKYELTVWEKQMIKK